MEKAWLRWGLVFALWTLVGLSFAAQFYFASAQFGHVVTWRRALTSCLADWYVFAFLSLPALWLVGRFRLEEPDFWPNVTIHLAASGVFSLGCMVLRAWIGKMEMEAPLTFAGVFNPMVVRTFHFNVLVYWLVVGLRTGLGYYRKFRERELRAAELEKRLAEARLRALQMQINPHFLFNTLNAIAALMHKDVEAADRALVRLGELLRMALDSAETQEVTLRRELDFLSRYLEIEQIRFGDRLRIGLDVSPDTLEALVPNLMLQPLVENAIRYGIEPYARPGRILLKARREGPLLRLQVQDSGGGLVSSEPLRERIGLSNTRARLAHLYGESQRLLLRQAPQGGLEVEIELPFHTTGGDRAVFPPTSNPVSQHENPNLDRGR